MKYVRTGDAGSRHAKADPQERGVGLSGLALQRSQSACSNELLCPTMLTLSAESGHYQVAFQWCAATIDLSSSGLCNLCPRLRPSASRSVHQGKVSHDCFYTGLAIAQPTGIALSSPVEYHSSQIQHHTIVKSTWPSHLHTRKAPLESAK